MPAQYIPLGANAYVDSDYGLPSIKLENWFAEEAGDRPDRPYRLLPTPGLTSWNSDLGVSPIRGWFQADGLVSGDLVVCAGTTTYRINSSGTETALAVKAGSTAIGSTYDARFAGSQADLVMTAGGNAYYLDGTPEWVDITVGAASGDITDVAESDQVHFFLEEGTGRVWYSDPGDPSTVQATSFVTAESEPDNVKAIRVYDGVLYMFGTQSTELWALTGDTAVPLRPLGRTVGIGLLGRNAVIQADFGIFAVGHERSTGLIRVYRIDGGVSFISTHAIDRLIEDVSTANRDNISLSAHGWGGHTFIGLHLPGVGDYYSDVATRTWHRRRETAETRGFVDRYISCFSKVFAASYDEGEIFRLDRDVFTEDGEYVRRVATGLVPVEDGRPAIDNLVVEMQPGVGLASGQGSDPEVMLRHSNDGHNWSSEVTRTFGQMGEYGHVARFDSLGRFKPPFMMIEVAVSDPVKAVVTGVVANRSRA
jgi:hypothetical protein